MSYNSELQSNNINLQAVLDAVNALPEASSGDPVLQSLTVTPTVNQQSFNPNGFDGYSSVIVEAVPTATQATPSISVSSSGLITATSTQSTGYVIGDTKTATKQLTVQTAQTITPTTSNQTISSGRYLTGNQTIKGDANLVAENIKKDVSIFGVTGTLETDANPILQSKTVSPSTSSQTVKPDSGYDGLSQVTVNAMTTATQATPSITVSTSGLITASATQTAGYVSSGTKSATKQLTTQAAQTITPSTTNQTISSDRYLIGTQTVLGDQNLVAENIKEGVSIFNVLGTFAGSGGSSGGGLPDGFSALTSGTATFASASYAPTIEHGLGVVPNVFCVVVEGSPTTADFSNYMIAHLAVKQTLESNSGYYVTLSVSSAGITLANTQVVNSDNINNYFNDRTIMPYGFFKQGKTYRWVAGVMDGIA